MASKGHHDSSRHHADVQETLGLSLRAIRVKFCNLFHVWYYVTAHKTAKIQRNFSPMEPTTCDIRLEQPVPKLFPEALWRLVARYLLLMHFIQFPTPSDKVHLLKAYPFGGFKDLPVGVKGEEDGDANVCGKENGHIPVAGEEDSETIKEQDKEDEDGTKP